eukprot:m.284936 g.284936  ORF g.284936 m.284936 type:complete len:176 (-) comp19429_c0_seq5:102-629(-)
MTGCSHSVLPDVVTGEEAPENQQAAAAEDFETPDWEVIQLTVRKGVATLGFSIKEVPDKPSLVSVGNIRSSGAAALAGVRKDDLLYAVDGVDIRSYSKASATEVLKGTGVIVNLLLGRYHPGHTPTAASFNPSPGEWVHTHDTHHPLRAIGKASSSVCVLCKVCIACVVSAHVCA